MLSESLLYICYAFPFNCRDVFAVQSSTAARSSSFQCPDCPKSFKRKNELKVHMKASHENVSFACSKCKKNLLARQMLNDMRQSAMERIKTQVTNRNR